MTIIGRSELGLVRVQRIEDKGIIAEEANHAPAGPLRGGGRGEVEAAGDARDTPWPHGGLGGRRPRRLLLAPH